MLYKVYVIERWEREYAIEANSLEEAVKIAEEDGCGKNTPIFGNVQQINDPKYIEDLPSTEWYVYDERENNISFES